MEETETADEEFYKSFEAWENETTDDFIKRYSRTEIELKETIDYLIRHREMIRDVELKQLEREANKLIDRLRGLDRQKLIAEIDAFKDILALRRKLIEGNGKS